MGSFVVGGERGRDWWTGEISREEEGKRFERKDLSKARTKSIIPICVFVTA